jgi:hypothetical protein
MAVGVLGVGLGECQWSSMSGSTAVQPRRARSRERSCAGKLGEMREGGQRSCCGEVPGRGGLLQLMQTEDELSAVLAHEVGGWWCVCVWGGCSACGGVHAQLSAPHGLMLGAPQAQQQPTTAHAFKVQEASAPTHYRAQLA